MGIVTSYLTFFVLAVVLNANVQCHQNAPVGGQRQSPINIDTNEAIYRRDLVMFDFDKPSSTSKLIVENDGHTIDVVIEGNFTVRQGGLKNVYSTAVLHFHWGDNDSHGSEHTINGVSYPLEMHIVNWNSDKYQSIQDALKYPDGLAVLGVLFEVSAKDNNVFEPIIQAVKKVKDPDLNRHTEIPAISMKKLLPPTSHRYYRYLGSLTTPNYDESVIWTVFENRTKISKRQLEVFRNCLTPSENNQARERIVNNYRQVQPLGSRSVYKSFRGPSTNG